MKRGALLLNEPLAALRFKIKEKKNNTEKKSPKQLCV